MAWKESIKKNRIPLSIVAIASLAMVAVVVFAIPVFSGAFTSLVAALEGFPIFSGMFAGAAKISYAATVATASAIVGGLVSATGFLLVGLVALTRRCLDKVGTRSLYERIPDNNEVQPSPITSPELQSSTISSVPPLPSSCDLLSTPEVEKIIHEAEECIQTHEEAIDPLPGPNQELPPASLPTPEVEKVIHEADECIQTQEEEIDPLPVANQELSPTLPVFPKKGQPTLFSSRLAKSEEIMSGDKTASPTLPARN